MEMSVSRMDPQITLRWSDFDWLGHVNNVRFVELGFLALPCEFMDSQDPADRFVSSVSIEYFSPKEASRGSVFVSSRIEERSGGGSDVLQSIYSKNEALIDTHAAVRVRFGETAPEFSSSLDWKRNDEFVCELRTTDGFEGFESAVTVMDFMQDARGQMFADMFFAAETSVVVVRVETVFDGARYVDSRPATIRSAVTRVGRSSFDVVSQVLDGGGAMLAESVTVLVSFDRVTKKSRPLTKSERETLAAVSSV